MYNLIDISSLHVDFYLEESIVPAINGIDLAVKREKILGIVGESGCGKSVLALSIMGLIPSPGKITNGKILFNHNNSEIDLTKIDSNSQLMRNIRGNKISMIFQEPMTSLNPVFNIGDQIIETIRLHQKVNYSVSKQRTLKILNEVGFPDPATRIFDYPHQLSGGMLQRVMIAMALVCKPLLLIADEPTTALDVTIQAQVLKLMNEIKLGFKTTIIFITHDLGVIAKMADEVAIMYVGKIVEHAPVNEIFSNPKHPYTIGLLQSMPTLNRQRNKPLSTIKGNVPNPGEIKSGCNFYPRCPKVMSRCKKEEPLLLNSSKNQKVSCFLYN